MQMDKKRKTLLVVTLVAFGYLGYQIYGLVSRDVSNRAMVAHAYPASPLQAASAAPIEVRVPQAQRSVPKRQPLVKRQKTYLKIVNQYELVKMKRRLLEEEASIAEARHRIAVLNKQTREINAGLSSQTPKVSDVAAQLKTVSVQQLTHQQPIKKHRRTKHISAVRKHPVRVNPTAVYSVDETRLLRMQPHGYMIQLIGSFHRDVIKSFAKTNHLGKQAMQFHVMSHNKPWYMLLYGHYQTFAKARRALHHFPANLKVKHPWIRRVANVQYDICRRRHLALGRIKHKR